MHAAIQGNDRFSSSICKTNVMPKLFKRCIFFVEKIPLANRFLPQLYQHSNLRIWPETLAPGQTAACVHTGTNQGY